MTRILGVLTALYLAGCNPTLGAKDITQTVTIDDGHWQLVWVDEFEGPVGTRPDPEKWTYEVGGHGFGNAQQEFDTNSADNAQLDGQGNLRITALRQQHLGKPFTSARLNTLGKFEQTYGRYEFRAKMPQGTGLWPALWLLASDYETNIWPACGEIDIMEMRGQKPGELHGSLHGPGYSGGAAKTRSLQIEPSLAETFHRFSIIWSPQRIEWFVDDQLYHRVTKDEFSPQSPWVFDRPFFMIVNLAVGGNFVGPVPSSTSFPAHMLIDYVRVYTAVESAP